MRPVFAVPLFAFAFALGFNTMGKVCMVRTRVARAMEAMPVSTTTITSADVPTDDPLARVEAKAPDRKSVV